MQSNELVPQWKQMESMRQIALDYMSQLYPGQAIKTIPKNIGQQLGCQVIILDDHAPKSSLKYYVKTFSNGAKLIDHHKMYSPFIAPPPLKELLVYKALAYMGFGPKCDFISKEHIEKKREYYLFSQDLSFTSRQKDKRYTLFAQVPESNRFNYKGFINLLCLDLLINAFQLYDIHDDNFGQILTENKEKWYIHDFAVRETELGLYSGEELLHIHDGSFKIRESTFCCMTKYIPYADKIEFLDFLKFTDHSMKILQHGRNSDKGPKLGFESAIDKACDDVLALADQDYRYTDDDRTKLNKYVDELVVNFGTITDFLDQYLQAQEGSDNQKKPNLNPNV